jgi:hypothetical protein
MEFHASKPVNEISTYLPIVHLVAQQISEVVFPFHLIDDDPAQKLPEYLSAGIELFLPVVHVVQFISHQDPYRIGNYLTEAAVTIDGYVTVVGIIYNDEISALRHIAQHTLKCRRTGAGGRHETEITAEFIALCQISEVREGIEAYLYRWGIDFCLNHDFSVFVQSPSPRVPWHPVL